MFQVNFRQLTWLAMASLVFLASGTAQATNYTFVGNDPIDGQDWFKPLNWSPNGVPGAGDSATVGPRIVSGVVVNQQAVVAATGITLGSLTVTGTRTGAFYGSNAGNVYLNGATNIIGSITMLVNGFLGGSGNVSVSSAVNWSGGQISADTSVPIMTLGANSVLTVDTTDPDWKPLLSRTLVSNGTINVVGASSWKFECGTLTNNGTCTLQSDASFPSGQGGTFNNVGTLTKSGGTGVSQFQTSFNNSGTVNVNSGIIEVARGGSSSGNYLLASGTKFRVASAIGYHLTGTGSVSGAGTWEAKSGECEFDGTHSVTKLLQLTGGSVGGIGSVTVQNGLLWDSGSIAPAPSGLVTIANTATGTINAANNPTLGFASSHKLTNNGQLDLIGLGTWNVTGTFTNNGKFYIVTDSSLASSGTFNNTGTLNKSGPGGITGFQPNFNNSGTFTITSGTVRFSGNFVQTAGSTNLDGGNLASSLNSNSAINIQGGTIQGAGTITGNVTNTGGTASPGIISATPTGILNQAGNYTQATGGTFNVELNGTSVGTQYDQLNVTGAVSLGGTLNVTTGFTPAIGATFTIIKNDGTDAVTGTFTGLPQGALLTVNNVLLQIVYDGGDGNDVTLTRIAPPTLSINDITITEGTGASKNANFTISLSFASPQTVNIGAIPANGTAKAPADYTGNGQSFTFAPGETKKTFSVPVIGDTLDEDNETFFVLLSSPVNASVLRGRGACTIADDDAAPSITIENLSIGEGNSGQRSAGFRLHLSAPSGKLVKVNYSTGTSSTATPNVDYTAVASTQIAFTTGQTVTLARVLINGDLLNEPDETFKVNLSGAINATIADNQAIGTILNDDTAPALSINDVSITEGNSGTKNLTFTVSLSAPSGQSITVNFATADGVARSTTDYVAKTGTLTFAAGQTSKTVSVTINGDTVFEGDETFFVLLSGATNASISKARGVGTITNDDSSV